MYNIFKPKFLILNIGMIVPELSGKKPEEQRGDKADGQRSYGESFIMISGERREGSIGDEPGYDQGRHE